MSTTFKNVEAAAASGESIDFSFGRNWQKYLDALTPERLEAARDSLKASLDRERLDGLTFLDAGCGSGVFSQSALELGASEVVSVDIDPNSIACARYLRSRLGDPERWTIRSGSLLQSDFVESLEPADVVYSWGVLHHTGAMWAAIEQVLKLVKPDGVLCLALYRPPRLVGIDMALKRTYNRLPSPLRLAMAAAYSAALVAAGSVKRRTTPWRYVADYGRRSRGMSLWRDVEDWLGGLPCEFADAGEVRDFVEPRGFRVERSLVRAPRSNNEYLLRRVG